MHQVVIISFDNIFTDGIGMTPLVYLVSQERTEIVGKLASTIFHSWNRTDKRCSFQTELERVLRANSIEFEYIGCICKQNVRIQKNSFVFYVH